MEALSQHQMLELQQLHQQLHTLQHAQPKLAEQHEHQHQQQQTQQHTQVRVQTLEAHVRELQGAEQHLQHQLQNVQAQLQKVILECEELRSKNDEVVKEHESYLLPRALAAEKQVRELEKSLEAFVSEIEKKGDVATELTQEMALLQQQMGSLQQLLLLKETELYQANSEAAMSHEEVVALQARMRDTRHLPLFTADMRSPTHTHRLDTSQYVGCQSIGTAIGLRRESLDLEGCGGSHSVLADAAAASPLPQRICHSLGREPRILTLSATTGNKEPARNAEYQAVGQLPNSESPAFGRD